MNEGHHGDSAQEGQSLPPVKQTHKTHTALPKPREELTQDISLTEKMKHKPGLLSQSYNPGYSQSLKTGGPETQGPQKEMESSHLSNLVTPSQIFLSRRKG